MQIDPAKARLFPSFIARGQRRIEVEFHVLREHSHLLNELRPKP